MWQEAWTRLDLVARAVLPAIVTLALILIGLVPLRMADLSPVVPSLAVVAVFYWTIHRPALMPIWAVFLVGLFHDLIADGPLGVGILTLLLVHALVEGNRRFLVGTSFAIVWLVFALVAAAAAVAGWALTCLIEARLFDFEPTLFRYFGTVAVYPCLAWLFGQLQRLLQR